MRRVRVWMGLLLCAAAMATGGATTARAQVSAYAMFTAADLANGPKGDFLYGGSGGLLVDGPHFLKRLQLIGDVDATLTGRNGERYDGVTIGPRFALTPTFLKLSPYVGFDVGFARFNDGSNNRSTDSIFGGRVGATRAVTPRFDAVVEYRYQHYGYNFNTYSPKVFSGGVLYHFSK